MIIFDASTLILLAKAELLEPFLADFNGKVLITKEVEEECCRKQDALDSLMIQKAIKEKRITVKAVRERSIFSKLRIDFSIGDGEAETLAFALSQKNALVAIDDRRGIKACKLLKLPLATAINFVVRLKEKQLLTKEEAIAKLDLFARHGRYSEEIISKAKAGLEARKQ